MHGSSRDPQRGIAFLSQVIDLGSQFTQGFDQRAHRPLAQAFHAVECDSNTLTGGKVGGQEPHGCTRCPHMDVAAVARQGFDEHIGVIAQCGMPHLRLSVTQCGNDQRAVADAFG